MQDECVYTVYVRTGSIIKAGTDSKISLALFDQNGVSLDIPDLKSWGGLQGPNHSYFERGNLDIFSRIGPCISGPVCSMNLASDGSGPHHGWYCNYVEVTTTGPHIPCAQKLFTVEQWLARDAAPYELTALRDNCTYAHTQQDSTASSSI
ncbi:PLAT domain-containing protein 3-like [Beta vulgaris subsp. vulgaris]|uniref:PLAT domain-containing protein 3-like n=1 Tax=Beta vulgaris subsp. vulgaris TaxID=3555 RepID=UPI002036B815|nr:PLAT domain-containing protein 3-like [Beta vulgaris subsp. vulgaris]